MRRYGRNYDRDLVSRGYAADYAPPLRSPYWGWYPAAMWTADPIAGWGPAGWPAMPPPVPPRHPRYDEPLRRPPRESPAYGRGGERAARQWARSHGYDEGYPIEPRRRGARYGY